MVERYNDWERRRLRDAESRRSRYERPGYARDYERARHDSYGDGVTGDGEPGRESPSEVPGGMSRLEGRDRSDVDQGYQGRGFDRHFGPEYGRGRKGTTWSYTESWLTPGPYTGVGPAGY